MTDPRFVLITGANRGLGLRTAQLLAERGWTTVVACRSQAAAEHTAATLRAAGGTAFPLRMDVTDSDSVAAAAATVGDRTARLHALVNNAGVFDHGEEHLTDLSPSAARDLLLTNAWGPLLVVQAFLPLLTAARPATVVSVTSQDANPPTFDGTYTAYRMSKSALNTMTRNLALALHPAGITVNAVDPGWIPTDMGGPEAPDDLDAAAETVAAAVMTTDPRLTAHTFQSPRRR